MSLGDYIEEKRGLRIESWAFQRRNQKVRGENRKEGSQPITGSPSRRAEW
jgi:hypothetical protein